jgi:hypothetical protein
MRLSPESVASAQAAHFVAIKVLRPDLAAAVGNERFVREIEVPAQRSDVHALGCLLDEMPSGEAAFPGATPQMALVKKVSGTAPRPWPPSRQSGEESGDGRGPCLSRARVPNPSVGAPGIGDAPGWDPSGGPGGGCGR